MEVTRKRGPLYEKLMLLLTFLIVVITPFASDSYSPSLPAMTAYFGSSSDAMQLTMTSYLFGVAVSQLIYGPLSDRFGRRPIILIGIFITIIGSLLCAVSTSVFFIIFARLVQGGGAGVCNCIFRALMRDQFTGPKMAQVGSYAGMVYTIAFAAAPVIGGYVQTYFGWRANFLLIALVVALIFITLWFMLPETHLKRDAHAIKFKNIMRNYLFLLSSPAFVGFTIISGAAYSGFVAYYTAAPFILEIEVGLTPAQFGWLSIGIAFGLLIGMFANVRLVVTKGLAFVLWLGLIIMFVSSCAMLIAGLFNILNTYIVIIPIILFATASGFVFANAMTFAFHHVGHIAGIAGGMYGFLQVVSASLTSIFVAKLHEQTVVPLACVLLGLSLVAIILNFILLFIEKKKSPKKIST